MKIAQRFCDGVVQYGGCLITDLVLGPFLFCWHVQAQVQRNVNEHFSFLDAFLCHHTPVPSKPMEEIQVGVQESLIAFYPSRKRFFHFTNQPRRQKMTGRLQHPPPRMRVVVPTILTECSKQLALNVHNLLAKEVIAKPVMEKLCRSEDRGLVWQHISWHVPSMHLMHTPPIITTTAVLAMLHAIPMTLF